MKRSRILIACIILFVGVNVLLVYLDDNGTVERKSYVNEWSEVSKADFYKKIEQPGVLTSIEKNDIYFDENTGSFQEFLIEEGAKVNQGDQLYSYHVHDYYDTKTYLTNQMTTINGEIAAIKKAISEISTYRIPSPSASGASTSTNMDETKGEIEIKVETSRPPIEAEYMKEQYLTEKEKELAREEAQLASIQTQLTELESGGDTITVESPYSGNVALVSDSLGDPIITIVGKDLHIVGKLTEDQREVVNKEMSVEIAIDGSNDATWKGTITNISDLPEEIALQGKSDYPFSVAFAEDAEEAEVTDLLPGYHADLSIITKESKGATALLDDAMFGDFVWEMTNGGKLVKQKVETGLEMDGMKEIKKGAKPGEWVAKNPEDEFLSGAIFLTPLKLSEIKWGDTFHFTYKNWNRYAVMGILSR